MSELENMRIAREAVDAWNARDARRYASLLDREFVAQLDPRAEPVRGPEARRQAMEAFLRDFPSLHVEIEQMLASGDQVVLRWRASVTHRGERPGLAPAEGWREGVHGCTVLRLANGKIVDEWVYWDAGSQPRSPGTLSASGQVVMTR